jgi:ABC-type branched-subunit amino acid transport system substrate-binding protein
MTPRRLLTRRKWLSAAGLLAVAGCTGQSAEEPIWVGHIGPVGARGEPAIDGMQQKLADLREDGVTVAGRSVGVRHVEAKDKTRARAEAARLLAVNRVVALIVGPDVEGVADVIATARSHGAVAVVLGGTSDRVLADQAVWLDADPQTQGEMLARYAVANGLKAYTSNLKADHEVLRGFAREFAKGGKSLGAAIRPDHLRPRVNFTTDVNGEVVRDRRPPTLLRQGPGGRPELGMSDAPDGEVWTLRMQPGPASLVADDRIRGDNLIAGLLQAVAERESLPADGKAWAERYEKRVGAPPDDAAILAADAIALIADGLRVIGRDDRQRLAAEIAGRTEIAGLTGPIVWKDGRTLRPMWVERVVKGKRVAVDAVPE